MKVLVIGSGAREHAIVHALQRSPQKPELFCFGVTRNPGIQQICSAYAVGDIQDCNQVVEKAGLWGVDLAIIGPEAPLLAGAADALWGIGIACVGPKKILAQIETSKLFARDLMKKYHIPGLPRFQSFTRIDASLLRFIRELGAENYVIKANGLMGGKGVKVAGEHLFTEQEALAYCEEIFAKKEKIVIEEKLLGQEFSFMCFTDGLHLLPMPLVQDHKRAYEGDKGPNTGGMGSYSDANHSLPFLTDKEVQQAFAINQAVLKALSTECKESYIGILYGSFIATKQGVYVIEFNARFGDPEALNVLSLLESDFLAVCQAMVQGELGTLQVEFLKKASVCKYLVPHGYPEDPIKDFPLDFSPISSPAHLYLSSVHHVENQLLAAGSRTAAFVGVADTLCEAEKQAELAAASIPGPLFHRPDIGTRAAIQSRVDAMLRLRTA